MLFDRLLYHSRENENPQFLLNLWIPTETLRLRVFAVIFFF